MVFNNTYKQAVLGCIAVLFSAGVSADGVEPMDEFDLTPKVRHMDFYASDKAAEIRYFRDSSVINIADGRINVGFLFNEKRDNVFSGGIVLDSRLSWLPGASLSFGGRLYAGLLAIENADVFGLAPGVEAAYELPVRQFPLQLEASFYYAPDIISFGQSDRIFDWHVRAGIKLRESIVGFVGLRYLEFDTRPGDRKLDNRVHVGVRWHMDR